MQALLRIREVSSQTSQSSGRNNYSGQQPLPVRLVHCTMSESSRSMEDFERLESKIGDLASQFDSSWSARRDWKGLWALIKSISADFKATRYPTREGREQAWKRFQAIVERIKAEQAKEFDERKARQAASESHLTEIRSLARLAEPDDGLGEFLVQGIAFVASGGLTFAINKTLEALLGKLDEEHERLRRRSEAMKSAWAYLSRHKQDMRGADKAAAFQLLQATKVRLDADWQTWKERRQGALAERNKERQERHDRRTAKQEEWRAKQNAFVDRLEEAEYKLESALSHRQEHLEKLLGQYAGARSDDYRSRVEGWIEEERGRISDIEAKLSGVRAKLADARAKLAS
jgi:hypothetical protein